ncbi:MAG: ABC transporter permease subunit [Anaerolineales bacterium]|nr:ABC transporter permease subunit [Anaerolineales bacterium]
MSGTNSASIGEQIRITWAIARKDIADAIKNKTTISIAVGVALLMLSAQAMPLLLKLRSEPRAVYFDEGESVQMDGILKSREVVLSKASSLEELESTLGESSGALLGLVIPANFDQAAEVGEQIELDGFFVHFAGASDKTKAVAYFEQELSERIGIAVKINHEENIVYPGLESDGQPFMVSLSMIVVILTIGALLVPILMMEEKEKHTMEALMVSPASYSQIVAGKAVAGLFYCITAAAVVLLMNFLMINLWGLALLAVLAGALFTVAIGLLLGTVLDNPVTLNLWLGVMLIILLIPVFLAQVMGSRLPEAVSALIPWLPSMAMSKVLRISFSRSFPLDAVLLNLAIIAGFAVVTLALVVWRVRRMDR